MIISYAIFLMFPYFAIWPGLLRVFWHALTRGGGASSRERTGLELSPELSWDVEKKRLPEGLQTWCYLWIFVSSLFFSTWDCMHVPVLLVLNDLSTISTLHVKLSNPCDICTCASLNSIKDRSCCGWIKHVCYLSTSESKKWSRIKMC